MPSGCNVRNFRIQKLSLSCPLILFPTWNVVNDISFGSNKVLTHGQERLFRKVTYVSIHSFVEWLDTFSYVLRPADVTVKAVSHITCFAIDIAKDLILLSCRLTMERLSVLQLETALATLVTTWFTLGDRRWRSTVEYREKKINKRVSLVLTYHPSLEKFPGIVRHLWKEIEKRETLAKLFPEPPVVACRWPKSIKDTLVRAAVSSNMILHTFTFISFYCWHIEIRTVLKYQKVNQKP
jgi:hypothetical protein